MNQLLADDALGIESYQNELSSDSTIDKQIYNNCDTKYYSCCDCRGVSFENANDLEKHLVDQHLKTAEVLLQRLTEEAIRRLSQRRGRQRKGAFARKRSHSYLVPRVKSGKKGSLKLKLKVSGSDSNSFEVVPVQKVLVGPGELYPLNGGVLGEVKTESFLTEVEWEKSLEGSSEQPEVASSGERTLDEESNSYEKENSVDSNKSNEDEPGDDIVNAADLDNDEDEDDDDVGDDDKDSDNGDLLTIGKEELDIPPSPAPTPSATPLPSLPSPSTSPIPDPATSPLGITSDPTSETLNSPSNEQLDSDFLPSVSEGDFSQSPNMVEINNSSVADVRSPAFPTTSSPATPSGQPTPPSEQQNSQSTEGDENPDSQDLSNAEQLPCDDSSDGATSNNFVWTDVSANDDDLAGEESNSQALEERDPLLLNDPPADQGGNLQGSPNAGSVDGSDQSILRGFLADHNAERAAASVSGVSGLEGFTLGSEYISLERLGDNAVICDVCGERAADQAALQDHKFRAGHFKCSQPECGGIVYPTADELIAHQQTIHGSQQYSQQNILNQSQNLMNQQSAPVQQLVQQVQRLPVPQMSMQALNKAQQAHSSGLPQQLASSMVTLIPTQQNQYQPAVCRPPPLYPAPAPNMMQQQHQAPPPYPGHQPQHVMFPQPYPHSQSFSNSPRQAMQMQPRPYSAMMQQMNQNPMRHQTPRVQVSNVQQRGLTAQNVGSPVGMGPGGKRPIQGAPTTPNKQRRMDMLIPDVRHDDADCHVIAMQKRTESGPLITGVQGSGPTGQSPSSRQGSQGDSTINLTDSITLSVRGQNSNPPNGGKGRNDANSVASLLATRGITVTPAGATGRGNTNQVQVQSPQAQHRQVSNRQPATSVPAPPPQPAPQPVTTLNLNSAISIIPTASARTPPKPQQLPQSQQPGGNFAVPQGRSANRPQQQAQVERPPRPPTVDLTGDGPPPPPALNPMGGRGRGRGRGGILGRNVCQLCDKPFPTLEALNQHMVTHRPGTGKLPFRCNMCTAQYPTQQGLLQHRQSYHKESPQSQMNSELVLPVVDLKQPATVNRLNSLGVRHYIPLSQLSNQSGGILGLPIVVLERGQPPSANVSALGAATILTLGPLRQLPR